MLTKRFSPNQHSAYSTPGRRQGCAGRPQHAGGGRRPGYLRGQRALPPGAGPGTRRGGGAGRARLAGARPAPGGSVPFGRRTRIPARLPGPLPQENGAKGRLLPNNSAPHSHNNAGEEPGSRGQGTGKQRARLRGSFSARTQYFT